MAKVERFEDLIAWQKARGLTRSVYEVTRNGDFAKDYGLSGQIQRAAVSIMSNIAEGFKRGGRGESHHFLSTAKASCAEVGFICMWPWMRVTWTRRHATCSCSKLRKRLGLWAACAPLCKDRKQPEANERPYSSSLQLSPESPSLSPQSSVLSPEKGFSLFSPFFRRAFRNKAGFSPGPTNCGGTC